MAKIEFMNLQKTNGGNGSEITEITVRSAEWQWQTR